MLNSTMLRMLSILTAELCSCVVLPVAAITVDLAWLLGFTLEDIKLQTFSRESYLKYSSYIIFCSSLNNFHRWCCQIPSHQWLLLWDEVVKNYKQLKAIHKKTLCLSQLSLLCWYHMSSKLLSSQKIWTFCGLIYFLYSDSDDVATRMLPRSGSHIFSQNFHIVT